MHLSPNIFHVPTNIFAGLAHLQISPQPLIDLSEGSTHVCKPLYDAYEDAAKNYFIKERAQT